MFMFILKRSSKINIDFTIDLRLQFQVVCAKIFQNPTANCDYEIHLEQKI